MDRLLEVNDLRTHFTTAEGLLPAVDGVTFHLDRGETLGVVGESGCGKSVTSLSIMRLVPTPPGRYAGGQILFEGKDILTMKADEVRKLRGKDIGMIFQEPMTSLNPVYPIGYQLTEVLEMHEGSKRGKAVSRAEETLRLVGVPDPGKRLEQYPHELSGGLRQRVMIAIALILNPKLLIADEPTTALDVTIQAQILELMRGLKEELGMSIMLITHDLGVVAEMAERVVVMYAGKVVEEAPVRDLFSRPQHPYTAGLLTCVPRVDQPRRSLAVIPGTVPNPLQFAQGCRFNPRCSYARPVCLSEPPPLVSRGSGRVACHFAPDEWTTSREVPR
ncbi:MAG: ABC transporter ATP-binding protein [Bacillota bacterium]